MKKSNLLFLLALLLAVSCLLTACGQITSKSDNEISGLADLTATCGDSVPELHATAAYGDVTYGLAKAVEGTAKENLTYGAYTGTLTHGTWYVKASVAETANYKGAEKYAVITVSHQAFAAIAGDGVYKNEQTGDGKIHSWYEKTCACGEVVIGNEQISDRHGNAITGLSDINANCGDILNVTGIGATYGTPVLSFAKAEEGKEKDELTWSDLPATALSEGVYFIRASVAADEAGTYEGAVQYATVTVTHIPFDRLTGEEKIQDPADGNKGYNYKECVCGGIVRGDREFVTAAVRVNGDQLTEDVVEVGHKIARPDFSAFNREGYLCSIVDTSGNVFDFDNAVANDFVTYDLYTSYIYDASLQAPILYEVGGAHWMFIVGSAPFITEETVSTFNWDDATHTARITSRFYKDNTLATPQIILTTGRFTVHDVYTFTFSADSSVDVWFGDNYDAAEDDPTSGAFHYTGDLVGKTITVTVTKTDNDSARVMFGDTLRVYDWNSDFFEDLTFRMGNKEYLTDMTVNSDPYTVTVSAVNHLYDYAAEAKAILAGLPENADGVTEANVYEMQEKQQLFEAAAAHFTVYERKTLVFPVAIAEKITDILGNKLFVANNLIADLPAFSYAEVAGQSAAQKNLYFRSLVSFLVYTADFTQDDMAALEVRYPGISRKVAMYRHYFAKGGVDYALDGVISGADPGFTAPGFNVSGTTIKMIDAVVGTPYEITLPAIPLFLYESGSVYMYLRLAPGGDGTLRVTDVDRTEGVGATTNASSNWVEVRFTKNAAGKWQAEIHVPDATPVVYVDVSDDVVSGKVGYTIAVELTGGTNSTISLSLVGGAGNRIYGRLTEGDTKVYEVNYTYYDGSMKTTKVYYLAGDRITSYPPAAATYETVIGNYTLSGWQVGDTRIPLGEAIDFEVTADIDFVAVYDEVKKQYSVTYYDDTTPYTEDELPGKRNYNYGDTVELPTVTPDGGAGFAFVGWFTTPTFDDGTQYIGGTIEGNLDLYAKFVAMTPAKVTLTNLAGDDIIDETNYIGSVYVKPEDPVREGYIFGGWYNAADDSLYDFTAALTGDIILYARWYVPDDTKGILITAEKVKNSLTYNWGLVDTKDYGRGFLYSSFGETEAYRLKEGVKIGGEGLTQLWTLPVINFSLYTKLEFAVSNNGGIGTLTLLGTTFTSPTGKEQKHFLLSFSDGKLNIYGINSYGAPIATIDVPSAVWNGTEAMTIQFACTGELLVTEFIAENKYADYVANAVALDEALAAWCNANIGSVTGMTDEQKVYFAKQLNALSIARAPMTAYEQGKYSISDITAYIKRELDKLDDAWFNLFGVDDIVFSKLYRNAENDKVDQAVMNAAYGAMNKTDKVNYYAFVTDGVQEDPGVFTLPKFNFKAMGMTLSFNVCAQGAATSISFDGGSTSSKLTTNLQYCFVVSVYEDAAAGKWYMLLHGDSTYKLELTEAQADGREALVFKVIPDAAAWYQFYISDISATF